MTRSHARHGLSSEARVQPNGSRLSCGANAGGRKRPVLRYRLAGAQTSASFECRPRQLQALVRRPRDSMTAKTSDPRSAEEARSHLDQYRVTFERTASSSEDRHPVGLGRERGCTHQPPRACRPSTPYTLDDPYVATGGTLVKSGVQREEPRPTEEP